MDKFYKLELPMSDCDFVDSIEDADIKKVKGRGDHYFYHHTWGDGEKYFLDTSNLTPNAKLLLKYILSKLSKCEYHIVVDTGEFPYDNNKKDKLFNELDGKEINVLPEQTLNSLVTASKELNTTVVMKDSLTEEVIPILAYCISSGNNSLEVGLNKYFTDCYESITIFRKLINKSLGLPLKCPKLKESSMSKYLRKKYCNDDGDTPW